MNKKIAIILISIIVLLIAGLIIFQTKTSKDAVRAGNRQNSNNPETTSPVRMTETDQGMEYVYENEDLGFQLTLPESFSYYGISESQVDQGGSEQAVTFLPAGGGQPAPGIYQILVHVRQNLENKLITDWANLFPYKLTNNESSLTTSFQDRQLIQINDVNAISQTEISNDKDGAVNQFSEIVYAVHLGKLYVIQSVATDSRQNEQYKSAFDELVSSWKFIGR